MAGRSHQFDCDQTLIKSRNLFWRQGYEGTSMSDLVAELGIASARIYKAFSAKEQLFREAIADYESQARDGVPEARLLEAVKQALTVLPHET